MDDLYTPTIVRDSEDDTPLFETSDLYRPDDPNGSTDATPIGRKTPGYRSKTATNRRYRSWIFRHPIRDPEDRTPIGIRTPAYQSDTILNSHGSSPVGSESTITRNIGIYSLVAVIAGGITGLYIARCAINHFSE
jgi:hypothetical protein